MNQQWVLHNPSDQKCVCYLSPQMSNGGIHACSDICPLFSVKIEPEQTAGILELKCTRRKTLIDVDITPREDLL